MSGKRYHNLGWFARHPKLYELGVILLSTLRRQAAKAVGTENRVKVLDIACGTGALSFELAKLGHTVIGIDLDAEMLKQAVKKIPPGLPVSFVHGDALNLAFSTSSFEAATIAFAMHDVPFEIGVGFLQGSMRILVKGGCITIIDYNEPRRNLLARFLYFVAVMYESPNYRQFVKRGLSAYITAAGLSVTSRFTIFGGIQVVTCR